MSGSTVETSEHAEGRSPKRPKSRIGLRLTTFAIVLLVALGVAYFFVQRHKAEMAAEMESESVEQDTQAPGVDVVTVRPAPGIESIGYPGETRGWYESTIYARVNGYVANWFVDIGDRVKKGQTLATIETPDLDAQLQAAEHELSVSQSQVQVEQAQADFAKTTYDRWRDSPKGVVSEQERDEKKAEYSSSVAQLKSAGAKVSADQADVDRLNALEGFKKVTAPFDGIVTSRHVDIGDLVTSDSTANTTSLYTVAQISEIRLFVDVPQRASAAMDVGVPATATATEFPDRKFSGKITRTSHAIDPATRTLHVEVDIENPDGMLLPGMYMLVHFEITHKGLLRVPASALIFKSNGPQVAVVGSDGKVHFRDVSISVDNGDFVELGSGVSVNEKVALNLSSQIAEGDVVTPTDADGPSTGTAAASGSQDSTADAAQAQQ